MHMHQQGADETLTEKIRKVIRVVSSMLLTQQQKRAVLNYHLLLKNNAVEKSRTENVSMGVSNKYTQQKKKQVHQL
jgi:hypothetical protein